ncbi:MAG: cytoplasmic protein [Marinomonas sp.]|nr:cytoplasmic protein [Marinomonas sp.]RUM56500.1 MAG: cytoplasmic protein [Marinomonas sp.]
MFSLSYSSQFKKDFKKVTRMSIPDIVEVGNVIAQLQRGETLPPHNVDHALIKAL